MPALFEGVLALVSRAKTYQNTSNCTKFLGRIIKQVLSTAKSTVTGKKDFWQQSTTSELHKVIDVAVHLKQGYDLRSGEIYRFVTLDESVVFQGYDQFIQRFSSLAEIFDSWTRYESFVHVDVKGVKDILNDFESQLLEFTDEFQRTDFLDDLSSVDPTNSIFKTKLDTFKARLSTLDQRLWQALEEALEDDTVTVPRALKLMQKFESVSTLHVAEHIRYNIEKLYVKVLQRWLDELRDLQKEYESQKHSPPLPRNVPQALGACLWAQQLLRRLQEANEACNSVRLDVASTKLFRKTVRVSTSTEETLHDYINLWYKSWCDSVDVTRSGLQATVLIRHPDTLKLTVNFDPEIIRLIGEAKGFQRLGFLLPSGAKRIVQNEGAIKRHRDELQDMIQNYHRVQYRLDSGLKSILFNVIHDIDQRIQPGLHTITWLSLNIESFLASVNSAVANENDLIDRLQHVMKARIEMPLLKISKIPLLLLPEDRTYTLAGGGLVQFVEEQTEAVFQNAQQIHMMSKSAEQACSELISILPPPYSFHTDDNHYLDQLKEKYGNMAFYAVRSSVLHTLDQINERIQVSPSASKFVLNIAKPLFDVDVELSYPNVSLSPTLEEVQDALNEVVAQCIASTRCIYMWGAEEASGSLPPNTDVSMYTHIARDMKVLKRIVMLAGGMELLKQGVSDFISTFSRWSYLWKTNKAMAKEAFALHEDLVLQDGVIKPINGVDGLLNTARILHQETQKCYLVEQEINRIVSVHNISALALDTQAIKHSLRSEARAWTSMYGKELQSIARDMLSVTFKQMDHFITVLQQPIVQIKDVTRAHSELISSEIYAATGGPHLGAIEMIAEWLEAVSIAGSTEIRNDLIKIHDKITTLRLVRANIIQGFKQAQTKLLSAIREEASKFTASVTQTKNDLFGAKGPIQSLSIVEYNHDASSLFRNLQLKVKDLLSQLRSLHDAETASELSHTDGKDVEFLEDVVDRYNVLFDLYDDLCAFVQSTYSRNMLELTNSLNSTLSPSMFLFNKCLPINEFQKLVRKYESLQQRITNVPDGCNDNALHEWMKSLVLRHLAALRILGGMQDIRAMTKAHWKEWRESVLENEFQSGISDNATLGTMQQSATFRSNPVERARGHNVSFLRPWKPMVACEDEVFVGDILENLRQGFPGNELAEIAGHAAKESAAAQILKKINFEWTTEEFIFIQKGTSRVERRRMQMLDVQWARRKILQMDDDLMSLSEINLKSMQKDIEFWKSRLFNARSALQQFLQIQDEWLKYRFYLGGIHDLHGSNVIEHQFIGLFNQMRERPNLIEFCSDTVFSGSILSALSSSLRDMRKSLTVVLDSYRGVFPRLNFVDDADIVNMQYLLSVKPFEMDYMFPLIFTGIARLGIIQSDGIASGRHDDSLTCDEVIDHSGCRLQFTAAGIENQSSSIPIDRSLPVFLSTLCHAMQGTVSQQICDVNEILFSPGIKKLAFETNDLERFCGFSTQAVFVGLRCLWTSTCENSIDQAGKTDVSSALTLKPIARNLQANISLTSDLIKSSLNRIQYVRLCALLIDLRDATDRLEATAPKQKEDFDFSIMLRHYHSSELKRQSTWVSMVDSNFLFCNEWAGSKSRMVMTPHTLRLFLSIFQALRAGFGVSLTRSSFHERSGLVEELGCLLGAFCSFKQLSTISSSELGLEIARSLRGVARNDFRSILTLEDLHTLPCESIAVVCAQVSFLHNQYLAEGGGFCIIPNVEITSIPPIICYNPPGNFYWEAAPMPESMRRLFRPVVSLLSRGLDRIHVLSIMLASENIKDFALVSRKIHAIFEMSRFHPMLRYKTHLFSLLSSIKVVRHVIALALSNREEEVMSNDFLFEAIQVHVCSQLDVDEVRIFDTITKAISGNKLYQFSSNYSIIQSIEHSITQKIDENKLQRIPAQINGLQRLFDTMLHYNAIVVSGTPLSGKSTSINLVKPILMLAETNSNIQRMQTLNICPESLSSERLFGNCESDGGLTQWLKAHQSNSEMQLLFVEFEAATIDWYCMDVLVPMLSKQEYYIPGRCRIQMTKNCKFVLEVGGLAQLTPATAGHFGFHTVQSSVVKPEHVLRSWQSHSIVPNTTTIACSLLEMYFTSTIKFCIKELAHCTNAPDENIERESILAMNRALRMLDVGITRFFSVTSPSLSQDNHRETLEKLVIFSTVWGLTGTVVNIHERRKFSMFFQNAASIVLPPEYEDYDCLHNWFLDDSGVWQSWTKHGLREYYEDFFGQSKTLVPTPEMCCCHHLLVLLSTYQEQNSLFRADDYFSKGSRGVLLFGEQSCGKSEVLSSVSTKYFKEWSAGWVAMNSKTTSSNLQILLEQFLNYQSGALVAKFNESPDKVPRRQSNPANKLVLFIEDLHLGSIRNKDCPYALIRSLLADNHGVFGMDPKFSNCWVKLEVNLTCICCFTLGNNIPLSWSECLDGFESNVKGVHRVLNRSFAINMLPPSQDQVFEIFRTILASGYSRELVPHSEVIECISKASVSMISAMSSVFTASISKCHCVFDMSRIFVVAKGMLLAQKQQDPAGLVDLWFHECKRACLDWMNASGEDYKQGIKVIATVATLTRLGNETGLIHFLEESHFEEDHIRSIEYSFINQIESTKCFKELPTIADEEVDTLRQDADEEGNESFTSQQNKDNHDPLELFEVSKANLYQKCDNIGLLKAYFLHSFQVAKSQGIQFTGEMFLFDAFVIFLNHLHRAIMLTLKNLGSITVVEKMGGNTVNAIKLVTCMMEEISFLDVTGFVNLSQCLADIGSICVLQNKTLYVVCSADQQVLLADLISLADHGRMDIHLQADELEMLLDQIALANTANQDDQSSTWPINTIVHRTAANLRVVFCVQEHSVDENWPAAPGFLFHNPDLASIVKRSVILFEPSMEASDFTGLARRSVEKVNRALGLPGLPSSRLALHLGLIPTRCVGSIKLESRLENQRRAIQIECSNRYALFLREFQRILIAKARGLQWRHGLLRVARDRIDGVEVELKELRTRHKFISSKQTMNRIHITSLLTATQRIVAEIARCQSHNIPQGEPPESIHEALSNTKNAVLALTGNDWAQMRPGIRNALRVLLLLPEGDGGTRATEWSEISLHLQKPNILVTGELVELLAAMLPQDKKKEASGPQLNSSEAAVTELIGKSMDWWILSKHSMELSRLHSQLIVEQGRLDSACEERVRLIAQKTKASATERIGRKMLDFLLEYRSRWDARLALHSEYLVGLAIEASVCAAFLAYGTSFSVAAREALKQNVYADAIARSLISNPGPSLIECLLPMHDETPLYRLPQALDRNGHLRESVLSAVVGSCTCIFIDPHGLALSWLDVHEGPPDSYQYSNGYRAASTERASSGIDGSKIECIEGSTVHGDANNMIDIEAASLLSVLLPQAGFPTAKAILDFRRQLAKKGPLAAQRVSLQPAARAVTICSATDPGLRATILAAAERGRLAFVTDVTSEDQISVLPAALLLPPALKRLKRPESFDPMSGTDQRGSRFLSEGERGSETLRINPRFRLILVARQLSPQLAKWLDKKQGISVVDFSEQAAHEKVLLTVLTAERPDLAGEFRDLPREVQAAAQRAGSAEFELADRLVGSTGRIITDPAIFAKLKDLRTLLLDTSSEVNVRHERHRLVVSESSKYLALSRVAGEISGLVRLLAITTVDPTLDVSADGLAAIARYSLAETPHGPNRIAEASELMRRLCYSRVSLGLPYKLRSAFGLALALRASASGATDDEIRVFAAMNIDQQVAPALSDLASGLRRSDVPTSPRRVTGKEYSERATRWESPVYGESSLQGQRGESPTRSRRDESRTNIETSDLHDARIRQEPMIRAHTLLRGLLPGEDAVSEPIKHSSQLVDAANASSVVFVAQAVSRLKQLGAEHVTSQESLPAAQARPRRRAKAADEAPPDLRKMEQPGSMRWLPVHLWTRMLWLADCWTSFRHLPYAMIHSRPPPDGPPSKHEWLTWFTANEPENLDIPSLFPNQQISVNPNPSSSLSPSVLPADVPGLAKKRATKARPIDRLMMIRLLRPDRLHQAIERFVTEVIGLDFPAIRFDAAELNLFTCSVWPTVIETGATPLLGWIPILQRHSQRVGASLIVRSLLRGDLVHSLARDPISELKACQQSGNWFVITRPSESPDILAALVSDVMSKQHGMRIAQRFRLWIVVESPLELPEWVLRVSFRIHMDNLAPPGLKNLAMSLSEQLEDEILRRAAQDVRFSKILAAFCMLHASIFLRQEHGPIGWLEGKVTVEDFCAFSANLQLALWPATRAAASRPLEWPRMRSAAEVDYAHSTQNPYDGRTLATLLRAYLQPNLLTPRYEVFPGLLVPNPAASASGGAVLKLKELLRSPNESSEQPDLLGLHPLTFNAADKRKPDEIFSLLSSLFLGGAAALRSDFSQTQLTSYEVEQIRLLAKQFSTDQPILPNYKNAPGSFRGSQRSSRSNLSELSPGQNLKKKQGKATGNKGKAVPSKGAKNVKRGSIAAGHGWDNSDRPIFDAPLLNERELAVGRSIQKINSAIAALSPIVNAPAGARVGVGGILMAHLVVEQRAFNGLIKTSQKLLAIIDTVVKGSSERIDVLPLTAVWQHALELEAGKVPRPLLALSWPCPSIDTWIQALNNAHFQLSVWAVNAGCPSYFVPALLRPKAFLSCATVHMACTPKAPRPNAGAEDGNNTNNAIDEGFRLQLLPTKKYSPDEVSHAPPDAEQRPGSPVRRASSRGINDGPLQVHGFMIHGARLEFSKLRLQEPTQPTSGQSTGGGGVTNGGTTGTPGPISTPGAGGPLSAVRLPVLQMRLAPLTSLPSPSAAAPPPTSVQDTTDIECPVLVAALPSESANPGQARQRWSSMTHAECQLDQAPVTGILFATEAGDAPRWASRGVFAAAAEPWSVNLAGPRHGDEIESL